MASGGGGGGVTSAATAAPAAAPAARQIPIVCPGHTRPLTELQFCQIPHSSENNNNSSNSGPRTLLVSACHDKLPMVRDGTTGDWIGTWKGHKGAVWSCRLDASGNLCATASGDFSVKVWDAITGSLLWDFPHNHIVKSCDFSPDSILLATGGHEGLLRIYHLQKQRGNNSSSSNNNNNTSNASGGGGKQKQSTTPQFQPMLVLPNGEKKVPITKLNWLDTSTVLTAGSDGGIRFWKISLAMMADSAPPPSPEPYHSIHVKPAAEIRDMEVSQIAPDTILTVAAGNRVHFYSLPRPSHEGDEEGNGEEAGGGGGGEKRVASTSTTTTTALLHSYEMPIHFREEGGASLHPSGSRFVAGGSDLWVRVFDFAEGKQLETHKGHHGPIRCVRYAPDGETYATGSEDGTIRLWRTHVAAT